jgi:serine/threonine-protein kinase HipA
MVKSMLAIAQVNLWGEIVGAVAWDAPRGMATFEFADSFLKSGLDIAPLQMPLSAARSAAKVFSFPALNLETYKGLPGMLADCLPDRFGNRLIDAWLAEQGRAPDDMNPVERLCHIGKRGMGALEFEPVIQKFTGASEVIEIQELLNLAKRVLNQRRGIRVRLSTGGKSELLQLIRVGTSAGGARAKAIIAFNRKTGEVRSGQISGLQDFEYYIIKFDGVTDRHLDSPKGYGRIEYAYHLMARQCGIEMSDCSLFEEHGRAHFMTKRFDRVNGEKLHAQTLCAIGHLDYNDPRSHSYEQAFQIMRQLRMPYADAEQLFRRMTFNVIARNQDDHTKNISFLMDQSGTWRLAPAYDITYAFNPASKWTGRHQLSVNGRRADITRADLVQVASQMNIKKPHALINEILAVVFEWKKFAKKTGVPAAQSTAIRDSLLLRL